MFKKVCYSGLSLHIELARDQKNCSRWRKLEKQNKSAIEFSYQFVYIRILKYQTCRESMNAPLNGQKFQIER